MTEETIKRYSKKPVICPKCGEEMRAGRTSSKRPGQPELMRVICDCKYAKEMVIEK
jgi:hypothetical protein